MDKKCFIAGLPSAGKTTYIAALWDIIVRNQGDVELSFAAMPEDASYLNEIREYWMKMQTIDRSKTAVPTDIRMNIERKSDGTKMVLDIPDFMGEQFQKIIDHNLSDDVKKWIGDSNRVMYLINKFDSGIKDNHEEDGTIEDELTEEERADEKLTSLSITPETMLEVSQNMMILKYIYMHSNIQKIAIGISAWDRKLSEKLSPEAYLKQMAPVLYNFIKYHFRNCIFFGVSAQGFDYERESVRKEEMKAKTKNSQRAYIVYGDEKEPSSDLTRPFAFLIS